MSSTQGNLSVRSLCLVLALGVAVATTEAAINENQVLVVVNTNSPTSIAIGAVYTNLHPSAHLVNIGAQEVVAISRSTFETSIRDPIRTYLTNNNLASTIIAIVTTKGLPYSINGIGPSSDFSLGLANQAGVDSDLTMLWQNLTGSGTDSGSVLTNLLAGLAQNYVVNPYHNTTPDISSFSRANILTPKSFAVPDNIAGAGFMSNLSAPAANQFTPGDMYLVTRISGYTLADSTNALMRSQHIYTDITVPAIVLDKDANNWDGSTNARVFAAAVPDYEPTRDALSNSGYSVTFDNSSLWITNASKPVIAYAGYGGNAAPAMPGTYIQTLLQFTYAPGAMFNTYESFNGTVFDNPAHGGSQGMIADFILMGGSLGVAHVSEPFTFAVADNLIMFPRMLTGGVTWAEAAWSAIPILSWQNIVIGDPLATITLVATNAPPSLAARTPTNNAGNVVLGATGLVAFAVQNIGNGMLGGTATVQSAGPFSIDSGSPFALTVGVSTNILVAFAPVSTGTFTNRIILTSNGGTATNTIFGTCVSAPSITSTPVTNVFLGSAYSYDVNATGFPTPGYALLVAPTGMTINAGTGVISWTPSAAQLGSNSVSVTATNGVAPDAVQSFVVTVVDNVAPTLNVLSPTNNQVFTNASITANGNAGDASGISGVAVNGSAATLTGTNWSRAVTLSLGTNLITVIATDASPSANQTTNTVTTIYALPPALNVAPANHDFGTLVVGQSSTQSFSVINSGGLALTGTATVSSPFSISSGASYSVSAGQTSAVSVVFAPGSAGTFSNNVIFASTGGNSTNLVTGAGAIVPSASFTGTPTNGLAPLSVTFTDNSTGTITSRSWDFGDGGTTNVTVTSVSHTYNSAGTNTVMLIVSGPVGVSTNSRSNYIIVTNLPPAQLSVTPSSRDFGTLAVGQTNTLSFSVINGGGQSLTGSVSVASPFAVSSGSPFNVAGGQTGTVNVSFIPVSAATSSNDVVFTSNGGNSTNLVTGTSAFVPVAAFSGLPTNGLAPLSVTFTDSSTGSITNRSWNFGDGGTTNTTSTSVPHTYLVAGTNTVTLIVSGLVGISTNTKSGYIIATNMPGLFAEFVGAPTNGHFPLTVAFTNLTTGGVSNSFTWTFGDGATSSATNPSHTYTNTGLFTVSLTAFGSAGTNTNTKTDYITVTNPPPAQLSVTPTSRDFSSVVIGQTNTLAFSVINVGGVSLTGTATVGGPFAISGGSPFNVSAGHTGTVNVSFIPVASGAASNTVVFSSNGGSSSNLVTGIGLTPGALGVSPSSLDFGMVATGATAQLTFVVTNTGEASLSGTAAAGAAPFSVLSGSPFTVAGAGSTNVVVRFAPTSAGNFTNSVIFSSTGGASTNTVIGSGTASPVAGFGANKTNGYAPLLVTFVDSSTGTITNRFWNFGDGGTTNTTGTTVPHTYLTSGTNTVTLIVTGPVGASTNAKSNFIVVTNVPPPVAGFTGSPLTGAAPFVVTFTDTSTGNITNRSWNFGDSGTTNTTGTSVPHTYNSGGTNTVTLIVSGPGGASTNARADYIVVTNPPPDTTAPLLTIVTPADNASFSNANLNVTGNAVDASGIQGVTVNGSSATLVGTNWSRGVTLSSGTNLITVIATDNSANHNATTQSVHAIFTGASGASDTNAPVVGITAPTNGFVTIERFIDVTGHATDDGVLSSVVVTNSRGGSRNASIAGTNWTASGVLLMLGTNRLYAVATDASTNSAQDMVAVIHINTNPVNTSLRVNSVSLTLGTTANADAVNVSSSFNDSNFVNPSNDVVEVMFGDYDAAVPGSAFKNLKYKGKASPSNTLTSVQFNLKKRSVSFAATGFTLTNADPFLVAVGLGTNDLGPDSISFPLPGSNAVGKFAYAFGVQLPNLDQFFVDDATITASTFKLAGTLVVADKPDPRGDVVVIGIGAFDDALATNGWVKGAGNVYTYTRPVGFTGTVTSMNVDFDTGKWSITGSGASLGSLFSNPSTDIRMEIGNFASRYPIRLVPKGTKLIY